MRFLIDTHLLLWAAGQPERLPPAARSLLESPAHDLWFSAASLWEIAIKRSLGRTDFRVDPAALRLGLVEHGYTELPIAGRHCLATEHLPALHRDPFDRILIAQAIVEGVTLLTADPQVACYPGPIRSV